MAPKAADVGGEPSEGDGRMRAAILLTAGIVSVATAWVIARLRRKDQVEGSGSNAGKDALLSANVAKGSRKEPSELLMMTLPQLVAALQTLPQSLEDVPELSQLLQSTEECCKDPLWLQHRDEPATDLAEWLCDQGEQPVPAAKLVEWSSRRQVLMEKLEELHDLKWDVPFDAEEEAIRENKIARDAAGME
mmetsp:Transcript_90797/g.111154  ORF Transcript_90797/g.111154 Transcript_90797/m.111154 type:complete len:191 (+) Transcript_90797:55-627(+)